MSASVIQAFYDAMRSMDPAALAASFTDDVVIAEPPSLPYGGTTTSRAAFFETVNGYTSQRASFRLETSEVLGDGERRDLLAEPNRAVRGDRRRDQQGGSLPRRHARADRVLRQERVDLLEPLLDHQHGSAPRVRIERSSPRSISRLRARWTAQAPAGCAVTPRTCTARSRSPSRTARTCAEAAWYRRAGSHRQGSRMPERPRIAATLATTAAALARARLWPGSGGSSPPPSRNPGRPARSGFAGIPIAILSRRLLHSGG